MELTYRINGRIKGKDDSERKWSQGGVITATPEEMLKNFDELKTLTESNKFNIEYQIEIIR